MPDSSNTTECYQGRRGEIYVADAAPTFSQFNGYWYVVGRRWIKSRRTFSKDGSNYLLGAELHKVPCPSKAEAR